MMAGTTTKNSDNLTKATTKKKKKKIKPKLKPIDKSPTRGDSSDELGLGFSSFVSLTKSNEDAADTTKPTDADSTAVSTSNNDNNSNIIGSPTKATPVNNKTNTKPPSARIQPHSTVFSPEDTALTPDADAYDVFGFGLVKGSNKASMDGTNDSEDATQGTTQQSSPQSLRRALSSQSYMSDSSTSEDELYPPQQILKDEDELENVFVKQRKSDITDDKGINAIYSPQRIHPTTTQKESPRAYMRSSSTGDQSDSVQHLMSSNAGTPEPSVGDQSDSVQYLMSSNHGRLMGASFSSTSSDELHSEDESSYFNEQRGGNQSLQINHQQLPIPNTYQSNNVPLSSKQQVVPPPLLMRPNTRQHPTLSADYLEIKLSLSESESKRSTSNSSSNGSPTRLTTTTPSNASMSSVDDVKIANELSAYSLSSKLRRASTSSPIAGRHAPVEGHHADSVISNSTTPTPVHSFYPTPQSAMLAATSQSATKQPRAHHDSSFLTNIREDWTNASVASASEGSFKISSPGGAFVRETEPINDQTIKSPKATSPSKSTSTKGTPQSHVQSLMYSDEDDNERRPNNRQILRIVDDEEANTTLTNLPNENEEAIQLKVYSSRWLMLTYISALNLLSGWTCYSVAPISKLVRRTLDVDSECLVALFLVANAMASVILPAILGRIGLRRTVLLGSLLLMVGNMIKSTASTELASWRVYVGFFIAGLSGPLYQNSIALISTSWFPKYERTTATKVAMYSNQLGIGSSFVLGILLVRKSKDVLPYFHLLSIMSSIIFVGMAMTFSDTPPTSPTGTVRVVRGTVERHIVSHRNKRVHTKRGKRGLLPSNTRQPRLAISSSGSFGSEKEVGSALPENQVIALTPSTNRGPISIEHSLQSYGSITKTKSNDDESAISSSPFPKLRDDASHGSISGQPGLDYSYTLGQQSFQPKDYLPPTDDDGAEPILIQTPRHLDFEICDDQIWHSIRVCFARKGFIHCVLSYCTAGITINILLTFMSSLVTLNEGARQSSVGVVGGFFQMLIMITSAVSGTRRDNTPLRFYMIIIALFTLTALTLALCAVNLDSGENWSNLLMIALFIGPVQPLSTDLG